MSATFVWLAAHSARNRIAREARRLRSPRYLLALVAAAVYLWFFLAGGGRPEQLVGARPAWMETLLAALLLGAALWAWLVGAERRALAFAPAEVAFLFPAPVTRTALIHYKLLRAQALILLNALFWALFLSREEFGVSAWLRGVAVWVLLSTMQMHRLGASLTRASLREHGRGGWRRHPVAVAVVGSVIVALSATVAAALPSLHHAALEGSGRIARALLVLSDAPALRIALAPFRLLARPLLAASAAEWWRALPAAAAVLVAHYVWVLRADTSFEEAAAEASFARARRAARRRGGVGVIGAGAGALGDAPLVVLAPVGRPAVAVFWKSVTALLRRRRLSLVLAAFVLAAVAVTALSLALRGGLADALGTTLGVWAVFAVLLGPQWIRNDLRSDLAYLPLLRTYPLRGRAIVTAEVAASSLVLTLLQLALAALAYLALVGSPGYEPSLVLRTRALLGAILVLPVANVLALVVHNAAALLLPAWVHLGPARGGRVEALGQALVLAVGVAIIVAVMLLPVAAAGALVYLPLRAHPGTAAFGAGVAALAAAAAEIRLLLEWLGGVFERSEPVEGLGIAD